MTVKTEAEAKPMTEERLATIDKQLVAGGEWVGTENEMSHDDGVLALNLAWELLAEVHRLRAREKVLHEAVRREMITCPRPGNKASCRCTLSYDELADLPNPRKRFWTLGQPERHAPNCPAAPTGGT